MTNVFMLFPLLLFDVRDSSGSNHHDGKTGRDEADPPRCSSDDHQADASKGEQRHHRYHKPEQTKHVLIVSDRRVYFPTRLFSQRLLVSCLIDFSLWNHGISSSQSCTDVFFFSGKLQWSRVLILQQ